MIVKLKGCPRCHGDMSLEEDSYGRYLLCLHCGHTPKDAVVLLDESIPLWLAAPVVSKK